MNRIYFMWTLRLISAVIMLQTLFFKFTASPVSVHIFTSVGIEPWGRIGTGILELIASILLLIPRTTVLGAILGLGLMVGAMLTHFIFLGIAVVFEGKSDNGQLFALAVITALCCAILIWLSKDKLIQYINSILKK